MMTYLKNGQSTNKLIELMNRLKEKRTSPILDYTIPDLWNVWNYSGKEMVRSDSGELTVNPYNFYYEVINSYIIPKKVESYDYSKPFHQMKNKVLSNKTDYLGGDWIKKSVVYSMMIRTSTAWDHDRSGDLESENKFGLKDTGTFVKTLALLPLLKKMGVDVVYMLPIFKSSTKNKKGELGSPYGVSNYYELDPNLKDPMTGSNFSIIDEFQAFVEACHILDMKVMIDIIPRTNAIENELMIDHPEWFYWIKSSEYNNYSSPKIDSIENTASPEPKLISEIYQSERVWNHIRKFSYDPKTINPDKYQRLLDEYKENPNICFSDLIKREYEIQIAPAFSDHINDSQPPWSDITFFRMYEDHPTLSQKELNKYLKDKEEIPPYILFDTIKNNLYQGNKPNKALWEMLSGIIPFYQNHFGIDGARIDMGHALSSDLLNLIISKAREIDPHFCFIAEELNHGNASKARELGYNMIIGSGFWHEPRFKERHLHRFMEQTHKLACPIFACGETHDTPRLSARPGGQNLSNMLTLLNMFVPNAVPFINSGQEIFEVQPMNTGIDARENEQYQLEINDPYYGKLALFDKYAFHYLNNNRWVIPKQLERISKIRKQYLSTITDINQYEPTIFEDKAIDCIGFSYVDKQVKENVLMIIANTNPTNETEATVVLDKLSNRALTPEVLFSQFELSEESIGFKNDHLNLILKPGEVIILKL
ncbi:alpha-amylase [Mycoplasmatota bacterium]|nr:alpha-amylase [Mycoplasmatota bacterium]